MFKPTRSFWIGAGMISGVLFSLIFAISVQRDTFRTLRRSPPFIETWELAGRSGALLRYLTLRYDLVAADFLWLRSIQSFGGRGMTNRDWEPIYNLFDAITELDPYFEAAYTFGNLVIGDEGRRQEEGLRLLHKGTFNIFRRYRSPFEGLYVSHWSMRDPQRAAWYGRLAKKRLDAPDWLPRIVAFVEIESGQYYIGYDRFLRSLLEAIDQDAKVLEDIALNKTAETIMLWNASVLMPAVKRYVERTGQAPSSDLRELADDPEVRDAELANFAYVLAGIELIATRLNRETVDPGAFLRANIDLNKLEPHLAKAKAELAPKVAALDLDKHGRNLADYQQLIFEWSLRPAGGVPLDPYGHGMHLNLAMWHEERRDIKERLASRFLLIEPLENIIRSVRFTIQRRTEDLGRFPKDLTETFFTDFQTTEPLGGRWIYDPETGRFSSSSLPDF
jgi:hypothetical protein